MATLALDDADLWYDSTGAGPPLVFIHGGWSTADAWRAQLAAFGGRYRAVAFDVRGHGRTGPTDRRRYSMALFADDLERLLDHLGTDRPILCGLSLGSMVVQTYLDRHHERAASAILAGPIRSMPPVDLPRGVKPFVSPVPAIDASLRMAGSRETFRTLLWWIRATTGTPWLSVDPAVRSAALDAAGDVSAAEFRKIFAALYAFDPPDLSHVTTPTLVLYGEWESPLVKRHGEHLAASVADGQLREVPNAGHLVNQDNAAEFNAASAAFLSRVVGK